MNLIIINSKGYLPYQCLSILFHNLIDLFFKKSYVGYKSSVAPLNSTDQKRRIAMDHWIDRGKAMVGKAKKILVFSGAGLSTDSGIPDFRSPGGVWEKYDPSDFYYQKLISDETAREKYWQMSREFYAGMKDALPNQAHLSIKALEDAGKLLSIVTQNIDHLHHKAGNSSERIIELHGTAFSVSCLSCGKTYDRDEIEKRLDSGVKAPYCDNCAGVLKPDTISFGQAMPRDKLARAFAHADECDLCIVLGSSLVVYPAASVPSQAARNKANLIIINRDPTPLDPEADLVIHESVSMALGKIIS
jgi:NAD-dependent deacetylase